MKALSLSNKKNKALSNIVAYVLLIAITISLSVLVYSWLRFYVDTEDIEACSEDVNVIIRSYECYEGSRLHVTLKNKGLFTVDGYEVRVNDRVGADFGFYLLDEEGVELKPGEEVTEIYEFDDSSFFTLNGLSESQDDPLSSVTFLEVQPFIIEGDNVRCKSYASQEVICN